MTTKASRAVLLSSALILAGVMIEAGSAVDG